jgi:hypothetical protein
MQNAIRNVSIDEIRPNNEFMHACFDNIEEKITKIILTIINRDFDTDFQLEHIFPQNPRHGETLRDSKLINNIGNLTLLNSTDNLEASNLTFDQKRVIYANSRLPINMYFN